MIMAIIGGHFYKRARTLSCRVLDWRIFVLIFGLLCRPLHFYEQNNFAVKDAIVYTNLFF